LKKLNRFAGSIAVLLVFCNISFGWGRTGHQIINGAFEQYLPASLKHVSDRSSYYVLHASDADNRKGSSNPSEAPRHFIDIDAYPEYASGTLTHNYDSLVAEYGLSAVTQNGTLPWAISSAYNSLVVNLESGQLERADSIIADLGHYVGDAYQPLHCTENYDGKLTGNKGIHSRFESGLLDDYQANISFSPFEVSRIDTSALEFAFRIIGKSNALVSTILAADTYAKSVDSQFGSAYYAAMWQALDTLMNEQIDGAAQALASLVYSAWLDAGSPNLTTSLRTTVPTLYHVSQVYPNPFNPTTRLNVTLPPSSGPSSAVVSVYSPEGRLVRSERRAVYTGTNVFTLDLSSCSSGVYFVVADVLSGQRHDRTAVKAVLVK
jgi:Secretion system C-terminal sorting domain